MSKKGISESKLLELGFKKTTVPPEESGCDNEFSYFVYETNDGKGVLISSDSDTLKNGLYYVEFYDTENLGKIYSSGMLEILITVIKHMEK